MEIVLKKVYQINSIEFVVAEDEIEAAKIYKEYFKDIDNEIREIKLIRPEEGISSFALVSKV